MARKPTQVERQVNLDRDLRDMNARLGSIETSIKTIEGRDTRIRELEFKTSELDKRIEKLEGYLSGGVKTVVGAVLVAVLSLVIGVSR